MDTAKRIRPKRRIVKVFSGFCSQKKKNYNGLVIRPIYMTRALVLVTRPICERPSQPHLLASVAAVTPLPL